jgi:hypothetical protein
MKELINSKQNSLNLEDPDSYFARWNRAADKISQLEPYIKDSAK